MIVCDFFEFFDELMSGVCPSAELGSYHVRLKDSLVGNYVELSPYCTQDDFLNDSDSYVLMRDFVRQNEQSKRKLAFSFVVLGRRFTHSLCNSYICYPYYARVVTFEHCHFSVVMVTTLPRKK